MKIRVNKGQTLWDALRDNKILIDRPCGGTRNCGQCKVELKGLGSVKSCCYDEPGEYEVILQDEMAFHVVGSSLQNGKSSDTDYIAIDVGTTTVAIKGCILGDDFEENFVNPQRIYGADVISRIQAANNGKLEELHGMIKNEIISKLKKHLDGNNIPEVIVAANTAMNHFLRRMDCEGIAKAPFVTKATQSAKLSWEDEDSVEFSMRFIPGIGAFVGGDIVSGMYGLGMHEEEDICLLVDLGTNGEMVLGKKGSFISTSAAAGPAFEGSDLARRIHAAGIISLLYDMKKSRIMDEYGTLSEDYFEEGYPVFQDKKQIAVISQDDIREIQMAKAAVRAGIEILLREYGICPKDISKVYLAGGMGFFIQPDKALEIGLFPEEIKEITVVGNSSLDGAIKVAKNHTQISELEKIVEETRELVLANQKDFEEMYINYMNF